MRFRYLLYQDLQRGSRLIRALLISGMLLGLLLWKSRFAHFGHDASLLTAHEKLGWGVVALALALLLLPAVVWLAERYSIAGKPPLRNVLIHMGGALLLAFSHLTMYSYVNSLFCDKCAVEFSGVPAALDIFISKNLLLSLLFYAVMLGSYSVAKLYYENRESKAQTDRLQKALQRAELRSLNAEINPHFIFNALQMIASLVHNDVNRADQAIMQLSNLLRITLRQTDVQLISLEQELAILKLYLDILQIRFGEALTIQLDIDPNALDAEIPHLLLQPLVENAIEHGATPETGQRYISITCKIIRNRLQLGIRDRGRGFATEWQDAGVGISNTVKRLEQLYGANHVFRISDAKNGGANVTIQIPHRIHQNAAANCQRSEAK